jgi:hypothetical protein
MQGMSSDIPEVRGILSALMPKIDVSTLHRDYHN